VKVGTLVRWTHPEDLSWGIVLGENILGMLEIHWFNGRSGYYPRSHKYMEFVDESW